MNNENFKDNLETLIIMALEANLETSEKTETRDWRGAVRVEDQGSLLKFSAMRPESSYTVDATGGRIYASDAGLLMSRPWEIFGRHAEVVMLSEKNGFLKWYGFERLKNLPNSVAVSGRVEACYAMHMRRVMPSGLSQYHQRIVPFDKNGKPLAAKIQGHWVCGIDQEGTDAILCASVIEDAHRSNVMLATVSDAKEIMFPVPLDDYKQLFSDRDGPLLRSGKRRAILHWVSGHIRRSITGNEHTVSSHARGIDAFVLDGLKVGITSNARLG